VETDKSLELLPLI